jgi:hypothetical protein
MGFKKLIYPYNWIMNGVMANTQTILSSIQPVSNEDNIGLQVSWTGTPTGSLSVNCSVDGIHFDSLTFNPALPQPAGSPGGYLISLNQLPFAWMQFEYTNMSGNGILNVFLLAKDLN